MRFLHYVFAVFFLIAPVAKASPAEPRNGVEYLTHDNPQPAEQGKRVEVLEFFGYFCPHCYSLDPSLENWVKKQGDNIVFKRVHTARAGTTLPQQRMYYALEAMGKADALHKKIFEKIHIDRKQLNDEDSIVGFMVAQGIDKQKFLDLYNSFSVQTKAQRAAQLETIYKLGGVPHVVIDGRFVTSPVLAGSGLSPNHTEAENNAAVLGVMDALVAKVGKERGKDKKQSASNATQKANKQAL